MKTVELTIKDDDEWEPDEDFFVQLYQPSKEHDTELTGKDCRTKITIIDDDKPGMIIFKEKDMIKAPATNLFADIVIERIKGSDGRITVDYETVTIPHDPRQPSAVEGIDFKPTSGVLEFENNQTNKTVRVEIV